MIPIPRTFCITLRETPKRKEETIKYLEQVGLKAEIFEGIHGESFGLKSTIPNYDIIKGREYFITPGAVGCILSHLTLWNILQHQPEDEFFIIEDDIQLCENFFEKFAKFKLELPTDWEIAHVGYIPAGGENVEMATHVSENVVINNPTCTHAYLVRKSALKTLIDTNQLAWSPLDIQIGERSLSKLHHYASKISLVSQRSVLNVKDDMWYSLCYDWNLDPEWLGNNKNSNMRLGNGWHPLEKNDNGYMIWSDGRGEFIFDDKWVKMDIDFIVEGEIEKRIRVVCPQQPDQLFEIEQYGSQHLSFNINGASSVIIVSDTFRPMDIFKTSDNRRLGVRLLKGITLTDADGKSIFVSLHSMYGAKKADEMSKVQGIKMARLKYSHDDGKINLRGQYSYNHHRSGWGFVLDLLADYHREDATVMDTWLERTFAWEKPKNSQLRLIPYREPWVGIFHHPPNTPNWFSESATPYTIIQSKEFQDSLSMCKGLYVLSKYHADFLKCFIKTVPIEVLYYPTETAGVKFDFGKFINNNNKKVVNIGYWLRKLSSIYQLDVDQGIYQKIRLLPPTTWVPSHTVETILNIEASFRKTSLSDDMIRSVIDVRYMANEDYDELLSKNILFIDLYDASANTCVVECIARGTPILINPLPAIVEYLGEDYPFYFSNLGEASKKLKNLSLIKQTHEYLVNSGISEKITDKYFIKTIRDGEIWKSLS
jgi:GR25 family glycosyltransferase involved in LPS biosynthesis